MNLENEAVDDSEMFLFTWSGGKDSALAFYELQKNSKSRILALLTTVTEDYKRTSMHGVRESLLEKQTASLGVPLDKVYISKECSNEEYEAMMNERLILYKSRGVSSVVFGDIFLEEIRSYREANLSKLEMKGIFPLWRANTNELASTFVELGFKAVVTCIDSEKLDQKYVGCEYNKRLIDELPEGVDRCGENGEFHTFVYDGPIFRDKIHIKRGEIVLRDNRFYFCDLIPE
jgi:uncharacterized protein (TIGR00290 family)